MPSPFDVERPSRSPWLPAAVVLGGGALLAIGLGLALRSSSRRLPASLPRDPHLDGMLGVLSRGYAYVSGTADALGVDAFRTRLLGAPALCMRGPKAARAFYVPGRFTRQGAMLQSSLRLLQDAGSVATLDGEAHRHRKAMFMDLMSPERIDALLVTVDREWAQAIRRWRTMPVVPFQAEVRRLLCSAVCEWAGVPLCDADVDRRTHELASMIDNAGRLGPANWRATALRRQTERWMEDLVVHVRDGRFVPPRASALNVVATHRDHEGHELPAAVAAVELLNVLRPVVAVASYITFAAMALHQHPKWRTWLAEADDAQVQAFVHEVRRYYPFFPAVAGRARHAFMWNGHEIPQGAWVVFDLFGTNHDPRLFPDPYEFRPSRFQGEGDLPPGLVAQGGGDHHDGHRCAGEFATIALMTAAVRQLTRSMHYVVPPQSLRLDLRRLPALPYEFHLSGVRPVVPVRVPSE